jgi:anti-sigma factor RsiW
MADVRPYDPERDSPLLSGYADGELDPEDRTLVETWLERDDRARRELDRVVQLKAFTDHLALRPAPEESWEDFRRGVYNRSERGLGWVMFWAGAGVVGIYLLLRIIVVLAGLALPIVVRLGLLLAAVGLLVLLVSVVRERLHARKRDRYDDVSR